VDYVGTDAFVRPASAASASGVAAVSNSDSPAIKNATRTPSLMLTFRSTVVGNLLRSQLIPEQGPELNQLWRLEQPGSSVLD
jgi:hypothetical protein